MRPDEWALVEYLATQPVWSGVWCSWEGHLPHHPEQLQGQEGLLCVPVDLVHGELSVAGSVGLGFVEKLGCRVWRHRGISCSCLSVSHCHLLVRAALCRRCLQQGDAVTTIVGVILVRAALCRRCLQQGDAMTTIVGVIFSFFFLLRPYLFYQKDNS